MSEQEIFLAAVEIADPTDRQAYLAEACAGDGELRQQVDGLLRAHAAAKNFLETPALGKLILKAIADETTDEQTRCYPGTESDDEISLEFLLPTEKPGSLGRLGHYEVHEVLGRGAFGIVLKAFDEKLHRMVAIKV